MCEKFDDAPLFDLTSSAEDSPAKTYRWLDDATALLESEADSSGKCGGSFRLFFPPGFSSKTSLACFPLNKDEISVWSSPRLLNSGMAWHGACLTLNTSDWPKDATVCSLSEVLEAFVAGKFFLSPKACRGILRRAERRGRELPERLRVALEQVASQEQTERVVEWIGRRISC